MDFAIIFLMTGPIQSLARCDLSHNGMGSQSPKIWKTKKAVGGAIGRDGDRVDVMLSEQRDLAAKAFFRLAKTVTGVTPDRVTTDGHDAYPRVIWTELGKPARHRTNRLQEHHFSKALLPRPRRTSDFLRCRSRMRQHVPAATRRFATCAERRSHSVSCRPRERDAHSLRLVGAKARKLTQPKAGNNAAGTGDRHDQHTLHVPVSGLARLNDCERHTGGYRGL